jgi:hypothetical protein
MTAGIPIGDFHERSARPPTVSRPEASPRASSEAEPIPINMSLEFLSAVVVPVLSINIPLHSISSSFHFYLVFNVNARSTL